MEEQNPNLNPELEPKSQPAQATEVSPAEKKALRKAKMKEVLKRLLIISSIAFLVLVLFIVLWTFLVGQTPFGLFPIFGLTQLKFNGFLMGLFNVLFGILAFSLFISAFVFLIKSSIVKKEESELKKKFSKKALKFMIGFFGVSILWLFGVLFLQPVLVSESLYESYIKTVPEDTINLSAPVEIIFDASGVPIDQSVYTILSYGWNFGDGSTGTGIAISHRYTEKGSKNGRYTVVLDVDYMDVKSGEQFQSRFTREVTIANEKVSASFTANPEAGDLPLSVTFDASSSKDPDGQIILYEWDLSGDGRFDDAEGELVSYVYTQKGEFEVSLRVTDNSGETDTASMIIEAGSIGGLRAVINSTVPSTSKYFSGEKYSFSAENSEIRDSNIAKYTWDFGDGSKYEGKNVSHTYSESGEYEITLTVFDPQGNKDTEILSVVVMDEGAPPQAQINTNPQALNGLVKGAVPFTIGFDGSLSVDPDSDIVDYAWDFDGDGISESNGSSATKTFTEVGMFDVSLLVTDSAGNVGETTIKVEVTAQGVLARLNVSPNNGEVPLTVQFDASASTYNEGDIVAYQYNFGDGNSTTAGSIVNYKYSSVGTFTATLTVLASDGKKDTTQVQIVVRPVALSACFTVNTDSGTAPLFVTVDPACSQGTIKEYQWDFGDGSISFDRKPDTHIYSKTGTYTVKLEITGDNGLVETFSKNITVK